MQIEIGMTEELMLQTFQAVLDDIRKARGKVLRDVNAELINLYWRIGAYLTNETTTAVFGAGVVKRLAAYLKQQEPDLKGFGEKNLWRMKQFYASYAPHPKLSALLREISWTNNLLILSRCKTLEEREFYLMLCVKERYSSRELERQITTGIFERTRLTDQRLAHQPEKFSAPMAGVFRDTYVFEFLDVPHVHSEADLQRALISHFKEFILELGRDFSFLGQEYRLQVGATDFFVDLLFFHRELQCLVAFELKIDQFQPEYLGQLEFYLEALDRDVKKPHERPSIGVLLCRDKDDEVVEYALSRSVSPTIVAEYETKLIPKALLKRKLHEFLALEDEYRNGNANMLAEHSPRLHGSPEQNA